MPKLKKTPPAEGGAVTATLPGEVNPQIKAMTGHTSEEDMLSTLPENTNAPGEDGDKPRRKRRSKSEMAAARGGEATPAGAVDPLLADKRYQRALGKATFFGAPKMIKGGFSIAAEVAGKDEVALTSDENEDVEDFFYALSKRRSVGDPFALWYTSLLYFVAMLAGLIGSRVAAMQGDNIQKRLAKMFGYGAEETPEGKATA